MSQLEEAKTRLKSNFNLMRFLNALAALILLLFLAVPSALASHIQQPTGYVNDFAGVLTSEQKNSLEISLNAYEKESGNEIAVAIVKSLNGGDLDDFASRTFEEWKIGKKGKDNGILFLAAIEERKMRIEVGYGLEPYLTDGHAGEIIRNIIAPKFKRQDYYGGIVDGIEEIKNSLSRNPIDQTKSIVKINSWSWIKGVYEVFGDLFVYFVIIVIYLFFSYLGGFLARSKSIWLGTFLGAIFGGLLGWIFFSFLVTFFMAISGAGLGYLFDSILSKNYQKRKILGLSNSWWNSGGGFFGGSSGGGFGGFGGGGSGGGGAGGGW